MSHCIVCKKETQMYIDVKNTRAEEVARAIHKDNIAVDANVILYCESCLQNEFEMEDGINISTMEWDGSGNYSSLSSVTSKASGDENITERSSLNKTDEVEIRIKPGPKCFKDRQRAKILQSLKRTAPDYLQTPKKRHKASNGSPANESPIAGPSNRPSTAPPPAVEEAAHDSSSSSSVDLVPQIVPNNQRIEVQPIPQINSPISLRTPERQPAPRIYNRIVPVEINSDDEDVVLIPNHQYIPQGAPLRQRMLPPDDQVILRKRVNGG